MRGWAAGTAPRPEEEERLVLRRQILAGLGDDGHEGQNRNLQVFGTIIFFKIPFRVIPLR